jgi:hypothetical protein
VFRTPFPTNRRRWKRRILMCRRKERAVLAGLCPFIDLCTGPLRDPERNSPERARKSYALL